MKQGWDSLIRSFCSNQMSDREQIAQVAQRKWATLSESLRSLKTNERPWAIRSGRSEEMSKWAIRSEHFGKKNLKSSFLVLYVLYTIFLFKKWANRSFPLFWWAMWVNRSGRSPKMSDVSKSLRSLTKNEWLWVIHSGRLKEMSNREQIAQVAHQKWANHSFF